MNAGFSNLDFLKRQLLANSIKNDVRFDNLIALLGLGVAAQFEKFCNRKFMRVENDMQIFSADYVHFSLERFPVESIFKIELKLSEADGWQEKDINDFVRTINQRGGIIYLASNSDAGPFDAQLRFTYTGGYFWNTLEPDHPNYPTAVPDGANLLPDDLKMAWALQCRRIWNSVDKLGDSILEKEKMLNEPRAEAFAPEVERTLKDFRRMTMV